MPDLCRTCGRPFKGYRRLRGHKVPDHKNREVNKSCVREFDDQVSIMKSLTPPINLERDGRLR